MARDHSHSILLYHEKVGMFAFSDILSQRLLELEMMSEVNPLDSWGKKRQDPGKGKDLPRSCGQSESLAHSVEGIPPAVNAFPKARQHQAWARLNIRVPIRVTSSHFLCLSLLARLS